MYNVRRIMDNEQLLKLFIELKNGNMDSFDEFYELTKRGVFSFSFQILRNQEEAENVLQDTYLQFLKKLPSLKPDKSILAYLMQTSKNLSLNVLKKYKKRDTAFDMETVPDSCNTGGDDDTVMRVMRETLKPDEIQIVLMHSLYDMTHKEIAKALRRPLGTITWSYNNSMKKMKEALKRYGYQE